MDAQSRHGYLPRLLRDPTITHHSSKVSGKIKQVLEHLSEVDNKLLEEEEVCRKKLNAAFYGSNLSYASPQLMHIPPEATPTQSNSPPTQLKKPGVKATFVPRHLRPKVSKATSIVSTEINTADIKPSGTILKNELIPTLKLEKQRSRSNIVSKGTILRPIKETKESGQVTYIRKNETGQIISRVEPDTKQNLTHDRMIFLVKNLLRDKRVSLCYGRNENRISVLTPMVCEGTPAWSQEVKSELFILVPVRSLCFMKWKWKSREVGYIEVLLPDKPKRAKKDMYEMYRSADGKHLSTSKLNKAMVAVFVEALEIAQNTRDFNLLPELNFDYLNDTIEFVFTKSLRIPLIPMLYTGREEPYYCIRPNIPDIDPTSDTLFRACFLPKEENILNKISTTDRGLRFDALKVIHTLCKQDWRLQSLSVYQLKHVLLHDIDFEIDNSPRWQRLTRDTCVQSVLKRLLYFVKKRKLPHFFQSEFDLFSGIPEKSLRFMETPLERLVSNEEQLLRDLQRAARSKDSESSSESDEDWW